MRCYLALGSNLRGPIRQLRQAIAAIRNVPRTTITKQSSIFSSTPLGVRAQPSYRNMVIEIQTTLSALCLLRHAQAIEDKHHRLRKRHWGSRTLDIDLILYGTQSINTPVLVVPHPHMLTRDFVLKPLLEIAPFARLPNSELIQSYLKYCEHHVFTNK